MLKKAHFAYSDHVNLDTSQSVARLLLNQNNGKNALLVCIPYITKYIQVGIVHFLICLESPSPTRRISGWRLHFFICHR